jgi:hypothetical protein
MWKIKKRESGWERHERAKERKNNFWGILQTPPVFEQILNVSMPEIDSENLDFLLRVKNDVWENRRQFHRKQDRQTTVFLAV